MNAQTRKSGDMPFLAAVIITILLGAFVILQVHRSALPPTPDNPKINPVKIQQLIQKGRLSDHPADYSEDIQNP
jgi:hypothetical protein